MGIEVSELYAAPQGEGPNMGRPSIFLRLRRCVLTCDWCDSSNTWDPLDPLYNAYHEYTVPELVNKMTEVAKAEPFYPSGLVITGGEPLIWQRFLPEVIDLYRRGSDVQVAVEVETAGTIVPSPAMLQRCSFNVSPKLNSSGNEAIPATKLWNATAVGAYLSNQASIKVVVDPRKDDPSLAVFLSWLRQVAAPLSWDWVRARVYLMPCAEGLEELIQNQREIIEMAKQYGVRYTTRAQILAYDRERAV